ncbi:MAG: radical SAM protein [Candidatus Omnitrophica bacterium]|nr:radical SAM protein [Candidatus Omnitrophota bacterium]
MCKGLKGNNARCNDVITIFGGIHPTAVPEKVLQNQEVDCVCIGEAERSFFDFLKIGKGNTAFILPEHPIEGIVFKKEGKIVGEFREGALADLNELPFPHKTPFFLSLKDSCYEYRIMASRGCSYSCSYCFNSYMHQKRGKIVCRRRKVDNVLAELCWARDNYPLKYVMFLDDSFTSDAEWILEFCERYKIEIGLPFACIANPHYMNKKIIRALSSAGCVNIQVGVESLSKELCNRVLHRKMSCTEIAQTIDDLRECGIMVQVDHMLGIPGDTVKLQEESILFYSKHKPDLISILWLTYYPRTPIVEIEKQKKLINDNDINNIEEGVYSAKESYLTGGSMANPKPYYSVSLLLNYLPFLPKWLISFLVRTHIYRILRIKNYFVSTALPRAIQSIFNKKDFRGRSHIIRFINKMFALQTT